MEIRLSQLELELSTLTDDCVQLVLEQCAPPVLLVLKGVRKAWRNHIRHLLCTAEWSERNGLPAAWAASACELE